MEPIKAFWDETAHFAIDSKTWTYLIFVKNLTKESTNDLFPVDKNWYHKLQTRYTGAYDCHIMVLFTKVRLRYLFNNFLNQRGYTDLSNEKSKTYFAICQPFVKHNTLSVLADSHDMFTQWKTAMIGKCKRGCSCRRPMQMAIEYSNKSKFLQPLVKKADVKKHFEPPPGSKRSFEDIVMLKIALGEFDYILSDLSKWLSLYCHEQIMKTVILGLIMYNNQHLEEYENYRIHNLKTQEIKQKQLSGSRFSWLNTSVSYLYLRADHMFYGQVGFYIFLNSQR